MAAIFISYRRDDSAGYGGRLREELEQRLGAGLVFRDADTIQPGQDFVEAIRQRLGECRVCLVLIGHGWLNARDESGGRRLDHPEDYVSLEIAGALSRADVLVVPVLVGNAVMPATAELPPAIQALARRQAIALRDDTWEADVDRLSETIRPSIGGAALAGPGRRRPTTPASRWVRLAAVAGVALLAAAWLAWPKVRPDDRASSEHVEGPAPGSPPAAEESQAVSAIEIPSTPEIALGDLIYTLLAGSVRPGEPTTLWLRMRVSNDADSDANRWDQSFRVAVGGDVVPASGGLNEILGGHSIRQEVVRFQIPRRGTRATLKITFGAHTGELPVDLTPTGAPPKHDEPDPGDALSRASIRALIRDPSPLITTGDLRATVTRAWVRRFANTIRVTATVRLENTGRYARASGDLVLRIAEGGEVRAPSRFESTVVEPQSTVALDAVFDLPSTASAVVLRGAAGQASGEIPLTVR
jgi:hypothetical protein